MNKRVRRSTLALAVALLSAAARGGALTDGSVGPVQSLSGTFTVPQALGTVRGGNLFHSFTRFGIASGESATFTTTDGALRHVIARVTGGEASLLQGPLALQAAAGSRPHFVLVNPSGITVAEGAAFDVPAGLHLSTAQRLGFADGTVWDTTQPTRSSLTVASPESFGFLTPAAALRWRNVAPVFIADDSTLELSAGDIGITASELYAGHVRVRATGELRLDAGSQLWALGRPGQAGGSVMVDAGALTLDGGMIYSFAGPQSAGGGGITLRVAGALSLRAGSEIEAGNFSPVAGGALDVDAGSIHVDGGGLLTQLGSQTYRDGAAGAVNVRSRGPLNLLHGGQIHSTGSADGRAGDVGVDAAALTADGTGARSYTGVYVEAGAAGAGALRTRVAGAIDVQDAVIWTVSGARETPGPVDVQARTIRADGRLATIGSLTDSASPSAPVDIRAEERITVSGGASLLTMSLGDGDAGPLAVRAPLIRVSTVPGVSAGITSSVAEAKAGNAGAITVEASRVELTAGGQISGTTLSDGNAGDVTVRTDTLLADGGGRFATGIASMAAGRRGDAGAVRLTVRDGLELRDGGQVWVANLGAGSPGLIDVRTGALVIDGQRAPEVFTGIGGDAVTYQGRGGLAAGSSVQIEARQVAVRNGGMISSSTSTPAAAGSVRIVADTIELDGGDGRHATGVAADTVGSGAAGDVALQAAEILVVNNAQVSSVTLGPGRGGSITMQARRMHLGSGGLVASLTGVPDDSPSRVSGDAGDITLHVSDSLTIDGGGGVFANTGASGAAGRIAVTAGSLSIVGSDPASGIASQIASRARQASSGQSGSITLEVAGALSMRDGAALTIENQALVDDPRALRPGAITVHAGSISLAEGSALLAASRANADAGRITLSSAGALVLAGSSIDTASLDGNGGPISITAGGPVRLQNARITTSVDGERNGNGGDLSLSAAALVLQTGFVQANTRAPRSRGGDVRVDVGVLLPDGGQAFVGGDRIALFRPGVPGLNVVQAAAPEGVSGQLAVTVPQLDLSGHLAALFVVPVDLGPLGSDLCRVGEGSSLTRVGRGALPERATDALGLTRR